MTSGIYQLNFDNQAYYIGQSQDMETRWKQHADKFLKGKAAAKMQEAYNYYGMPRVGIVIECHKDYLDIMETFYIHDQKQYANCLNTSAPALDPSIDYEWLFLNKHMLKFSSIEIIRDFIGLAKDNMKLEEDHEDLKHNFNKEYLLHKAAIELKHGKDENKQLVIEYHDRLRNAQEKVTKLLNRGLFDRLFNHQ